MRQIEYAVRQIRPKTGEDVAKRQLLSLRRGVGEALDDDCLRAGSHLLDDPIACFLGGHSAGHAWTKIDLGFRVVVGGAPAETGRCQGRTPLRSASLLCVAFA